MKQYHKESQFNRDIVTFLRGKEAKVQRIESGMTGRGIPDIYVASDGLTTWIESKRTAHAFDGTVRHIKWRPGQQPWMLEHYLKSGIPCFTLCAFRDCILALPMVRFYRPFDRIKNPIKGETLLQVFINIDHWMEVLNERRKS